jgi:proline iminopeptidase
MRSLYREIEPYDQGNLDVGDGHRLYWECCGNPGGKPAVVLHGGPGSGCTNGLRRFFHPEKYRIVLFDQRGCGRSRPAASDPAADLRTNTTHHLIEDIEELRRHLAIGSWLVFGGSWGSTLGLAYSERYPERVSETVLSSIGTTRRHEVRWMTRDVGRLFPKQWARFRDGVPAAERDGDLVEAYSRLLHDSSPEVREKAARDWCDWEEAHVSLRSGGRSPRWDDPAFRLCFARLVTHYWRNAAWLEDGILLREASRLAGIPGVLIHGRFDISSPVDIPCQISNAWPGSELVVVEDAGHSFGLTEPIIAATDRFADIAIAEAWQRPNPNRAW